MSGFLVDTNVISEILRPTPDVHVAAWSQRQPKQTLFLSVVSMGELRKGLAILQPGAKRTQIEKSIEAHVPVHADRPVVCGKCPQKRKLQKIGYVTSILVAHSRN